jgi:hypothetical protein
MNEIVFKDLEKKKQEDRLRTLAFDIVRYQNFKTKAILLHIYHNGYSKKSLTSYIQHGISYIKTKKKTKGGGNIFNYIDEAIKNCVTPLTPEDNEKRIFLQRKPKKLPIQNVLKKINEQAISKENSRFLGIKIGDKIIIKESLDEIKAFQEGLIFMGNNNTKLIKVKIEEI